MKQLIVMLASIMLGLALFGFILGRDGSIKSALQSVWQKEVRVRTIEDHAP